MADEKAEVGAGPPETVEKAAPSTVDAWDEAIGEWINTYVRNSPISNDVGAWNHLNAVIGKLRPLLEKALGKS